MRQLVRRMIAKMSPIRFEGLLLPMVWVDGSVRALLVL